MTSRPIAVVRLAGAAVLLACSVLLSAPPASACVVSIGYKPSLAAGDLSHHPTCSTGTSLTGAGGVALLVLGALGAAGRRTYQRGERTAGTGPDRDTPHPSLTAYLDATRTASPESRDERAGA
ncbi:hypothetical protein GCM10010331_78970 [Streptomyces xanthochromogenes]|uniref:hypothetical protein n=1 Tax=Streptomyces xanthochromogenes TaxID=67384 RepID=UPI001671E1A8|nr:hypothetical protein [Streptomyces xanthochromogenes]GHB79552.1 hypothetical protein GCM10010331_78970 [Streptomyces xanthochromogenes]